MSLDELILEGEKIKEKCLSKKPDGMMPASVYGEDYERWKAKCVIFLDRNKNDLNDFLVEKLKKECEKRSAGYGTTQYDSIVGILKAFRDFK